MTTSLAAVGVGAIGAGAANAATVHTGNVTHTNPAATTSAAVSASETAWMTVHADLSASTTSATIDLNNSWVDWGDGHKTVGLDNSTGHLTVPDYKYKAAGNYAVTLNLLEQGSSTIVSTASTAALPFGDNAGTVAVPQGAHYNTTVTAVLSGTHIDPFDSAGTVTIHWGDGKDDTATSVDTLTKTHVYTTPSATPYQVTVEVDDAAGGKVVSPAAPITINSNAIQPAIHAKQTAPWTVTADLTGSSVDPAATAPTFTINWGDGTANTVVTSASPATPPTHNYGYNHPGPWTITLTVHDGINKDATATTQVTVDGKQPAPPVVARDAGTDRVKTGLVLSKTRWADHGVASDKQNRSQAGAVVLATSMAFPDALSGVPLAKKVNGPLLLTNGSASALDPDVFTEIQRVIPADAQHPVYILGGLSAVSAAIQKQLTDHGYTVTRYGGADRFATSLQIAKQGMGDPDHIVVARGDQGVNNTGFADALAAGPYAAAVFNGGNAAVVLSNGPVFDATTKAYVAGKLNNSKIDVVAVGGSAVTAMGTIPTAVAKTVSTPGNYTYAKGATRYETAAMIASAFNLNAPLGVATGTQYPDALTGGAYMASVGGPLLLTDPATESAETAAAIKRVAATTGEVDIFGGTVAVSPAVATAIQTQVNQPTLTLRTF